MRRLDYCIGTHNTIDCKDDHTIAIHANLYHFKNKYVVDFRYLMYGVDFPCQVVEDYTKKFNSMTEVEAYFGKGYFKAIISRLPKMPHD